jgi:hypothetical protein
LHKKLYEGEVFFMIEVSLCQEEMEQGPMVEGLAQVEDWVVAAVEAGWEEPAQEQGPAEVASVPIAALDFHTKWELHAIT